MPGHANVLLAEADVPYDRLEEMDDVNGEVSRTDVTLVIGANDVTNPARTDPASPIYGMPILNVDESTSVIVLKRSVNAGFAGIDSQVARGRKISGIRLGVIVGSNMQLSTPCCQLRDRR